MFSSNTSNKHDEICFSFRITINKCLTIYNKNALFSTFLLCWCKEKNAFITYFQLSDTVMQCLITRMLCRCYLTFFFFTFWLLVFVYSFFSLSLEKFSYEHLPVFLLLCVVSLISHVHFQALCFRFVNGCKNGVEHFLKNGFIWFSKTTTHTHSSTYNQSRWNNLSLNVESIA